MPSHAASGDLAPTSTNRPVIAARDRDHGWLSVPDAAADGPVIGARHRARGSSDQPVT